MKLNKADRTQKNDQIQGTPFNNHTLSVYKNMNHKFLCKTNENINKADRTQFKYQIQGTTFYNHMGRSNF